MKKRLFVGDNEIFTFRKQGAARTDKPAAVILRTHAKKSPAEIGN